MKIMKFIAVIFLIIFASKINAQPVYLEAPRVYLDDQLLEFRFEKCAVSNREPDGEATVKIKRLKDNIYTLEIASFFGCLSEPSDPILTLSKVGITLSVKSHNTHEGEVALCLCEHKMFIKIKIPNELFEFPIIVNEFYYVQDQTVLGHAVIPDFKIQPTKP